MFAFRPDLLIEVLPIIGTGMLGIFLVTGVIIALVALINTQQWARLQKYTITCACFMPGWVYRTVPFAAKR